MLPRLYAVHITYIVRTLLEQQASDSFLGLEQHELSHLGVCGELRIKTQRERERERKIEFRAYCGCE